jgi:hypothetical protein
MGLGLQRIDAVDASLAHAHGLRHSRPWEHIISYYWAREDGHVISIDSLHEFASGTSGVAVVMPTKKILQNTIKFAEMT